MKYDTHYTDVVFNAYKIVFEKMTLDLIINLNNTF